MAYDDEIIQRWARQQLGVTGAPPTTSYAPVEMPPEGGGYAPVEMPPESAQEVVDRELAGWSFGRRIPSPPPAGVLDVLGDAIPSVDVSRFGGAGDPGARSAAATTPPAAAPPQRDPAMAPPVGAPPAAPVRQGQTVPGAMISDDGRLVPVAPPARPAPPRAGGGMGYREPGAGARMFAGGLLYPRTLEEAQRDVDAAWIDGEITEAERDRLMAELPDKHAKWAGSAMGMGAELSRMQADAQRAQFGILGAHEERLAEAEDARAARAARHQKEMTAHRAEVERAEQARQQAWVKQVQKYEGAVRELRDFRIDPDRYMSSQGGWGQFRTTLALMLGAGASAITGGPNQVLQILEAKIDRDIEAQKEELGAKRDAAQGAQNVLGMMRQQFDDQHAAEAAARRFMFDELKFELDLIGQRTESDALRTKIAATREALDAGIAQQEQRMRLSAQQLAEEQEMRRRQMAAQAASQQQLAGRIMPGGKDWEERYVPGVGVVTDKEDAYKLRGAMPRFDAVRQGIAELKALTNEYGATDYVGGALGVSEIDARYKSLARRVNSNLSQLEEQGVITDGERKDIANQIPEEPNVFFKGASHATIDATAGYVDTLQRSVVGRQQVIPVRPAGYDEKGKPVWEAAQ